MLANQKRSVLVIGVCLAAALSVAWLGESRAEGPVRLIFDTDIDTDCDDCGAVAVLHAMANTGEVDILATTVSSNYPYSAPCLDAFNRFYGRGQLPVGVPKRVGAGTARGSRYAKQVARQFPSRFANNDDAPPAVEIIRRVLADAEGQSVRIVTVGYLTNMADLLRSQPDSISPLSGRELIERKVSRLICMGGRYPEHMDSGVYGNFKPDPESARDVAKNWPGTIYFSGLGEDVATGRRRHELPAHHPLRVAYDLYLGDRPTRPSWDQTALLFAVRPEAPYWSTRRAGGNHIFPNGTNRWVDDDPGDHRLVEFATGQRSAVEVEIERLMMSSE